MATTPHHPPVDRTDRAAAALEDIAFLGMLVCAIALAVAIVVAMFVI